MPEEVDPRSEALSIAELIALGRDREAVAAATRESDRQRRLRSPNETIDRGEAMDGVQQLDEIIPLLEEVVDGITPDQLELPTPCASFTVSSVLDHMIGGAGAFAPAFRGEAGAPNGDSPADDATVTDRWRHAMADLLDAVHSPGAQERTIASPFGEVPGAMFARYVAFDGLIHGWDLATATGQSYAPPVDLVVEVDSFVQNLLQPEMRDGDTFAEATIAPPDADELERLVAFSGRTVATE